MNDIMEFIEDLKELQQLYHTGELRNFDFESKLFKFEKQMSDFEQAMEQEHAMFWTSDQPFYEPNQEV